MKWIESMRTRRSLKLFHSRSREVRFPHAFVDLDKAQRVAFIVNMLQMEARDLVVLTDYILQLEAAGKKVLVLELNPLRKTTPMFTGKSTSIFINPPSISRLGFPSVQKMMELNKWKPHILINLDTSDALTSKFVCGLSNASTRVGRFVEGHEEYYELMLDVAPATPLRDMLTQFETYLKMLEK